MHLKTELLFPTPIWIFEDCPIDNQVIVDFIHEVRKQDPDGKKKSNEGGWQSWDFEEQVCDTNPLKDIKDAILRHAYVVCDEWSFKDYILKMTNLWINVNKRGDNNVVHTHPGAVLSGAYYLDVPDCCSGNITFMNTCLLYKSPSPRDS